MLFNVNIEKEIVRENLHTMERFSNFLWSSCNFWTFEKHIVITNADYINHIGKNNKDITINYNILKNVNTEVWKKILDVKEITYKLSNNCSKKLSKEEIIKKIRIF